MVYDWQNQALLERTIEMKNKETPFCEPAQRTKSYVTGEQKGVVRNEVTE